MEREHKFLVERADADRFLAAAAAHLLLEVHDPIRPVTWVRTTYLDTPDLEYYRSCFGPVARRLRVREYAAAPTTDSPARLTGVCTLELKESAGTSRRKLRFVAPPRIMGRILDGEPLDAPWDRRLAAVPELDDVHALVRLRLVAPRLTTWYRRLALADERVRVTLDQDLAFSHPVLPCADPEAAEPAHVVEYGPARLLEVKVQGEAPGWLRGAMAGLREARGFSKFRAGLSALAPAPLAVAA